MYRFITLPLPSRPLTADTPGHTEHVAGAEVLRLLQDMFHVPSHDRHLGVGRDASGAHYYDYLDVECAWKVNNPNRSARYCEFRKNVLEHRPQPCPRVHLKPEYESAVQTLAQIAGIDIDSRINETLLLHGTHAEHCYSILYEGLDPNLSSDGLFGRGTYFAEDGAKIDQYLGLPDVK